MKLWDSLTTCLILLSAVHASPLTRGGQRSTATERRGRAAESPLELPPVRISRSVTSAGTGRADADSAERGETAAAGGTYTMEEPLPSDLEDLVDIIKVTVGRTRRSSVSSPTSFSSTTTSSPSREDLSSNTRHRRERKKGPSQRSGKGARGGARGGQTGRKVRGGGSGRGQGCVLKQIHLNVTDLGLGYRSGEEMIFKYCSGPCRKSETNYDKILYSLAHNRRFPPRDTPPQACCRPVAFDDDLSFLDDDLIYHTVRKHSARKCGCV